MTSILNKESGYYRDYKVPVYCSKTHIVSIILFLLVRKDYVRSITWCLL